MRTDSKKITTISRDEIKQISLGCMWLEDENTIFNIMKTAIDQGVNYFDTADIYGQPSGNNEKLIGKAMKKLEANDPTIRPRILIATKCGVTFDGQGNVGTDNSPSYIRQSIEKSLKRLGLDTIDVFYLHRIDEKAVLKDSIQAIAEFVRQGKIRYIGLSEVNVDTIKLASQIHPIHFIQNEFSLWSREPEFDGVLEFCQRNNIILSAYSPLARGFFVGLPQSFFEELDENDFRTRIPRYMGENLAKNIELRKFAIKMAKDKQCDLAQLCLAWIMSKGKCVVPVFGTRDVEHLQKNLQPLMIELRPEEIQQLDDYYTLDCFHGSRTVELDKFKGAIGKQKSSVDNSKKTSSHSSRFMPAPRSKQEKENPLPRTQFSTDFSSTT